MPVTFKRKTVNIGTRNPRGNENQLQFFTEHTFGRKIIRAETVLNGYRLKFTNGDHHLETLQVDTDAIIDDANRGTVTARIELMLADYNADDPFKGWVTVVIFVEYE
ncbi:MAG: hypothetical protein AAF611_12985 [Bacteroidota bacterium]